MTVLVHLDDTADSGQGQSGGCSSSQGHGAGVMTPTSPLVSFQGPMGSEGL